MPKKMASILIPTFNAGEEFKHVLEAIFLQGGISFEVLVADSESGDSTVSIAESFGAKVFLIKQKDFGHGKTRNFLARKARGRSLVFLTQDAVPESRAWLCNLVSAFGKSKRTAGVYGRQIAKPDAEDFEKLFFEKKYPVYEKVWNNSNWKEQDVVFSMVNAAVRKDLLLENPLSEETIVSEDYEWAYRMLAKGFLIAYEPSATVLHSHNYSLLQNFKRHFDIGYSYRQIYPKYNSLGFNFAGISFYCELLERSSLAKVPSILVDGFVRYSGLWLGRHSKLLPKGFCKALSNQKWFWK